MTDKTVNQLEEVEHFSYVLVADGKLGKNYTIKKLAMIRDKYTSI